MNVTDAQTIYRFEGFVLDLARGALLSAAGEEVPLRRKSFELLCVFLANAGRLLDRDTLNQAIWSDVIVTDDGLTQCVRDIRLALGDDAQRIIRTVPRRGYIFAASVTAVGGRPRGQPATDTVPLSGKPSIAVLAFTNMSGEDDQEYFSDGIADDIITELSRSRSLFVVARNSSFTYKRYAVDVKQVARELGVRYVVEGSVRRSDRRVRVTAQLIDAETGIHLWAERYDRDVGEVFLVQDEVTEAVTTAILPAVTDAEQNRVLRKPPENLGAWDLYHQGTWHFAKLTPTGNATARSVFEQTIGMDPIFAAAYVGLSRTYLMSGNVFVTMPRHEAIELGCTHARKAVELDAADPETHAILALALFYHGDMDDALAIARQALAINPGCSHACRAMGLILIFAGRTAEGREAIEVFTRLSPRDPAIPATLSQVAMAYYFEGHYARSVEILRCQLAVHPRYTTARRWLAAALGQLGRFDEAHEALRQAIAVSPSGFDVYVRSRPPWFSRPEQYEHFRDGLRKAGWQG
jgi:adenylate cyclase